MNVRTISTIAAFACAAAAVPALRAGASGAVTGPYVAAQAKAGAKSYDTNCARCHGAKLEGVSAPALRGAPSGLKGDSLSEAYTFISLQMPAGNPGSLSASDYVNIVAYILSQNGYAAGTVKLTPALAKKNSTVKL